MSTHPTPAEGALTLVLWVDSSVLRQVANGNAGDVHCSPVRNGFADTKVFVQLSPQAPAPAAVEPTNNASWFALLMNAAASLEDASYCLRDSDARASALGAAKHFREKAQTLWLAASQPAPQEQQGGSNV